MCKVVFLYGQTDGDYNLLKAHGCNLSIFELMDQIYEFDQTIRTKTII